MNHIKIRYSPYSDRGRQNKAYRALSLWFRIKSAITLWTLMIAVSFALFAPLTIHHYA